MGDRATAWITIQSKDLKKATEVCPEWDQRDDADDDTTTIIYYEANYGANDVLDDLRSADISFHGGHGEGGNYGACAFVQCGDDFVEVPISHEGMPIVGVNDEIIPDPEAMKEIKHYYKLMDKLQKWWE